MDPLFIKMAPTLYSFPMVPLEILLMQYGSIDEPWFTQHLFVNNDVSKDHTKDWLAMYLYLIWKN